ncbi:Ribokinase-like protein [Nemania abortiva]|nr:Ribokinase-like protein [Nemania abortiva]
MGQNASNNKGKALSRPPDDKTKLQHPPVFVSLGAIEFQEIDYTHKDGIHKVMGGSGLYATFGARLFKMGESSKEVGCLLITGYDFPRDLENACTKAYVGYREENHFQKNYSYNSNRLEPAVEDLDDTVLLSARSFHILGTPAELKTKVEAILELRKKYKIEPRPKIIWEPASIKSLTDDLHSHMAVLPLVDVFSPDHYECLFHRDKHAFERPWIESHARLFTNTGIGPDQKGAIVVRCGPYGCFWRKSDIDMGWIVPYWDSRRREVVDQTGAGSAFLGAFMVSYMDENNLKNACVRGSVAASFAIEQYGPPKKTNPKDAKKNFYIVAKAKEVWNDDDPENRYEELLGKHTNPFQIGFLARPVRRQSS